MRRFLFIALSVLAVNTFAQEMGRASLSSSDVRAPLPVAEHTAYTTSGSFGARVALGWGNLDWTLGPVDGSETTFVPEVNLFYMLSKDMDLDLSYIHAEGKSDAELNGVNFESEATFDRLGLGVHYHIRQASNVRWMPYLGAGLGYYMLEGQLSEEGVSKGVKVDDTLGFFLEGGVAYLVADNFYFDLGAKYDALLKDAEVNIDGNGSDMDASLVGISLGFTATY